MEVLYYRVMAFNGRTLAECNLLKDALKFCRKWNAMLERNDCKVVKVVKGLK